MGDEKKLNDWLNQKNIFTSVENEAKLERVSISLNDTLIETSLSEAWMQDIAEQLRQVEDIKAAWICEKIVNHYPEYPVYVLAIQKRGWFVDEQKLLSILNSELDLPDTTIVISLHGKNKKIAKQVKKLGNQLDLYKKSKFLTPFWKKPAIE